MGKEREYRQIREDIQNRVAYELYKENKAANKVDRFNPQLMEEGKKWYDSGFNLEDAPENLRNNINFVRGYEKSQRLQIVDDEFFKKGMEAYLSGIPWDEIDDKDKENVSFVFGYEDAMTMSSGKRR